MVDMLGSTILLPLILSAGDDTCVSSILAPSANFTGRLKIKQGLPSLPVAQGNLCVYMFIYRSDFILGVDVTRLDFCVTFYSFLWHHTISYSCIHSPGLLSCEPMILYVLNKLKPTGILPFLPFSLVLPPLGFSDLQHLAADGENTTKLSRNSGAENTKTHTSASTHTQQAFS